MTDWFPSPEKRSDFRQQEPAKKIDILAEAVLEFGDHLTQINADLENSPVNIYPEKPVDMPFQFDFGAVVTTTLEIDESTDKELNKPQLYKRLIEEVYKPLSRLKYPNLGIDYHRLIAAIEELTTKL